MDSPVSATLPLPYNTYLVTYDCRASKVHFANCYPRTGCGPSQVQLLTGRYPRLIAQHPVYPRTYDSHPAFVAAGADRGFMVWHSFAPGQERIVGLRWAAALVELLAMCPRGAGPS